MKNTIIFLLIFINFFKLCSGSLIDREIFWDMEQNEIQGEKKYFYDNNNNIISIKNYDADKILESEYKYSYKENRLMRCDEYLGEILIKYSNYFYDVSGDIDKKIDYDYTGKVILISKFIITNGIIHRIINYNDLGDVIGSKEFVYENKKLIIELQYNDSKKQIVKKTFFYEEDQIIKINYYISNDRLIRRINRKYKESKKNYSKSLFGYNENFYDFR